MAFQTMLVDLHCQLTWICNQLKYQLPGTPMRDAPEPAIWSGKTYSKLWWYLWHPDNRQSAGQALLFAHLPLQCAGKFINPVAAPASAASILCCHQNPDSSALPRELKTTDSPPGSSSRILQAFSTGLGLLRHPTYTKNLVPKLSVSE